MTGTPSDASVFSAPAPAPAPAPTRAWAATRKGLIELAPDDAGGWRIVRTHFIAEPVSMLLPPTGDDRAGAGLGGRVWAALNLGHFGVKIHASDDGGDSWHEVEAPTYPPQPADAAGPAWKLLQVWSLEAAGGALWAGTLPGGLFRSADGGASWQLVESLWHRPERQEWFGGGYDTPGIHSILPYPGRPRELLLGISCGGAWRSEDAGATWTLSARGMRAGFMPPERADDQNIQDPHRIVRCAGAPDVLWCQHHGGLWRSTDNAGSWHEITTAPVSGFGFAAAAHPADPETAWFVPAVADERRVPRDLALCVQRTRDGGRTFDVLRAGLPQRDCYDLVHRHALEVAGDGKSLLMGTTTGGLWSSADAGDTWRAVGLHLPPIHAVRFG